jgi:type IV secretion system protein VirB5
MGKNKARMRSTAAALLLACAGTTGLAGGIPVYDGKSDLNALQELTHALTQIDNQLTQIQQLQAQFQSTVGNRGLGNLYRNPALDNYAPADAGAQLNGVALNGFAGLSASARTLRAAAMNYGCQDRPAGELRTRCEATLGAPYQERAMLLDAMGKATSRLNLINGLITSGNSTQDQAAKLELAARINGEQAALANEAARVQMLAAMLENQRRVEEAQQAARAAEMLQRRTRLSDLIRF